jgi:hypothetical protein
MREDMVDFLAKSMARAHLLDTRLSSADYGGDPSAVEGRVRHMAGRDQSPVRQYPSEAAAPRVVRMPRLSILERPDLG